MRTQAEKIPAHVAIIMDGNGRWAKSKGLERVRGHKKGTDTVRGIVTRCRELGVGTLTLYAFSDENWKRPRHEISFLMNLLEDFLVSEEPLLMEKRIRLTTIGEIHRLPEKTAGVLERAIERTREHDAMALCLALSYGGRNEILRAAKRLARDAVEGKIGINDIDEAAFEARLDTHGMPDPDLIVRTSGEFRTSNFLPWQSTYAEWYITSTLWPDFTVDEFEEALRAYGARERRFGMTTEQLSKGGAA